MYIKGSYTLLRIGEYIDSLEESLIFSAVDLFNGFWQINIA